MSQGNETRLPLPLNILFFSQALLTGTVSLCHFVKVIHSLFLKTQTEIGFNPPASSVNSFNLLWDPPPPFNYISNNFASH